MPNGNATVVLRPKLAPSGALELDSGGGRFGGAGFYRVQARDADRVRVWRIATLKEQFRVYVDAKGALRCDHSVQFLGLPGPAAALQDVPELTERGAPAHARANGSSCGGTGRLARSGGDIAQPVPTHSPAGFAGVPPSPTRRSAITGRTSDDRARHDGHRRADVGAPRSHRAVRDAERPALEPRATRARRRVATTTASATSTTRSRWRGGSFAERTASGSARTCPRTCSRSIATSIARSGSSRCRSTRRRSRR